MLKLGLKFERKWVDKMKDFTNKHIHANYRKSNRTYIGSLWFYDDGFEYKAKSVNSNIKMGKISYSEIKNITFFILTNVF